MRQRLRIWLQTVLCLTSCVDELDFLAVRTLLSHECRGDGAANPAAARSTESSEAASEDLLRSSPRLAETLISDLLASAAQWLQKTIQMEPALQPAARIPRCDPGVQRRRTRLSCCSPSFVSLAKPPLLGDFKAVKDRTSDIRQHAKLQECGLFRRYARFARVIRRTAR